MTAQPASGPSPFDVRATEWDAEPRRLAMARGVLEAVRAAVPLRPEMRVMDFGAGTGLLAFGLLPDVAEVTAVDASAGMLAVLADKARAAGVANLRTLHCDIAHAVFPAARFDLIVSSMTLHHISDVPHVLRTLRPALRTGGWIALADLDAEDGSFHSDKTGVYHNGFARDTVRAWLEASGFADVSLREAHRMAKPSADGVERVYPIFLAAARAV